MPSGMPSGNPPSGMPSGMPTGGFGALGSQEARDALRACGIKLPSMAPRDNAS
jgi:hypothetical protein